MPQQTAKPEVRHVVVHKGCAFGQLVLHIDDVRNATACFVPRTQPPTVMRSYETANEARSTFHAIVNTFRNHGWTIIYDGLPNFG
jgi:hypothetical protein